MPDAYMVTDLIGTNYGDTEIMSPDEFFDEYDIPMIAGTVEIIELEIVQSFDHGNRTSEELCLDIAALAGELIMARLLILLGCDAELHLVDCFGVAVEEFAAERTPWGSWVCDEEAEEGYSQFQALLEFIDYTIQPMFGDCGFIYEQSADAGMTWLYAPVEDT